MPPPCEAGCPTGIPVQERWRLIREGRVDEAVDLALAYTPFPASGVRISVPQSVYAILYATDLGDGSGRCHETGAGELSMPIFRSYHRKAIKKLP